MNDTLMYLTLEVLCMSDETEQIKQKWKGVRYRYNGRSTIGVDCIGILYGVYACLDILLPGKQLSKANIGVFLQLLKRCCTTVKDQIQSYDIVLFRLEGRGQVLHCGVYLDNDEFIHVLGSQEVQVDKFSQWKPQFIRGYRLRSQLCHQQ